MRKILAIVFGIVAIIGGGTYVYSKHSVSGINWILPSRTDSIFFEKGGKVYVKNNNNNPQVGYDEVVGADVATFVVPDTSMAGAKLAYTYAKDKNHVYYRTRIDGSVSVVTQADSSTFVVMQNNDFDAQDKNHKYFAGRVVCEDPTRSTCVLDDGPGAGTGYWFQKTQ